MRTRRWGRLRAGAWARRERYLDRRLITERDLPVPTVPADVCAADLAASLEPAPRHRRTERNGAGRAGGVDGKDDAASGAGTADTDGGTGV
ncbi:hypothetical protein [Streptomyces monomycini]|uniref:hypothetical protein n=1 Tax=Streptomyces monomycini TaxID=371720 RepID=UPI000B203719|nr:hypothetical protein [Streptomyces monomycini]